MRRTGFKHKEPLTDAQKQIREAHREAKRALSALRTGRRRRSRSKPTWYKGVKHGSQTQVLVYQNFELIERAGEIAELQAEVDFVLNAEGGGQVGMHRIDIMYLDLKKNCYQVYNVKADYEGSIDALSSWKRRHFLKQYPTINGKPVRYDFFIADEHGSRVFRDSTELLAELGEESTSKRRAG